MCPNIRNHALGQSEGVQIVPQPNRLAVQLAVLISALLVSSILFNLKEATDVLLGSLTALLLWAQVRSSARLPGIRAHVADPAFSDVTPGDAISSLKPKVLIGSP
jgi:hypothetical protein